MMRVLQWIVGLAVCLGLPSCTHKELCFKHFHPANLRLEFDWSEVPEADPAGMAVFFYPVGCDEEMRRIDFTGRDGGEIELPCGVYHVICYNNDSETVMALNHDDHGSHTLCTRQGDLFEPVGLRAGSRGVPLAPGTENQPVYMCPDEMVGVSHTDIEVTPDTKVITLHPRELTCVYTYEIRNIKNLKGAIQVSLSLSGMASHLTVHGERLSDRSVTIPFGGTIADEKTITGRFVTFGHHADNPDDHRMMLYVWMPDGRKYAFGSEDDKMNVTDQVENAPNQRRVHLIVDGLEVPSQNVDDCFDPTTDDWETVNYDIPM